MKGLQSHFAGAEVGSLAEATFYGQVASEREWIEEGVLVELARETGGKAILDGSRSKALEKAVDDTRSYYSIGFSPNWQENDERHRVRVQALGKGLKSRNRRSFSDLSRQTTITMMVESAQLFDLPLPSEEELTVAFGEPQNDGWRKIVIPLELEIPLDKVTLLPGADGYTANLELRVAVTDDRGDNADIPVIPIELHQAVPAAGGTAFYTTSLRLRDRPHRLLISLYDPASGTVLAKRAELML